MDYNVRRYYDERKDIEVRIDKNGETFDVVFSCSGLDGAQADRVFEFIVRPLITNVPNLDFMDPYRHFKTE